MADHYGASHTEIARFLKSTLAKRGTSDPGSAKRKWGDDRQKFVEMQERWAVIRKQAEANLLRDLAAEYGGRRKSIITPK